MAQRSPAFGDIEREVLTDLLDRFFRNRMLIIPLPAAAMIAFALLDDDSWRRWVLVGFVALMLVVTTAEAILFWRRWKRPPRHMPSVWAAALGSCVLLVATGGLESPFLTLLPVLGVAVFMSVGASHLRWTLVVLQLAVVWLLAGLQVSGVAPWLSAFGGGVRGHLPAGQILLMAYVLTCVLTLVTVLGSFARETYRRLAARVDAAREAALTAYTEHTTALTTLAAEIAHEIKNPLASVKGLAALVAPGVGERNGERMAVLRREIDRMSSIVDEFLHFSRPLGPLSRETVELDELCREVAALHEGAFHARRLTCRIEGRAAVQCDRRKTWQILMNLVQNAMQASPEGAALEIDISVREGAAAIRVDDRGAGIAGLVAGRVFEPGVTSKRSGSGLGLTVARALARQHGGDVELTARAGGGTSALVTMPVAAP